MPFTQNTKVVARLCTEKGTITGELYAVLEVQTNEGVHVLRVPKSNYKDMETLKLFSYIADAINNKME